MRARGRQQHSEGRRRRIRRSPHRVPRGRRTSQNGYGGGSRDNDDTTVFDFGSLIEQNERKSNGFPSYSRRNKTCPQSTHTMSYLVCSPQYRGFPCPIPFGTTRLDHSLLGATRGIFRRPVWFLTRKQDFTLEVSPKGSWKFARGEGTRDGPGGADRDRGRTATKAPQDERPLSNCPVAVSVSISWRM